MNPKRLHKTEALALFALFVGGVVFVYFFVGSSHLGGFGVDTSGSTATFAQYSKEELIQHALSLINSDRQASNVPNVTLSSVASAQQHAEDMLETGYFSHWDTKGYKPYVRYTLAGGKGKVSENIAVHFGSPLNPKAAIKDLEWNMMNDDAGSDWEHRNNILDAFHNKVSIGIAYDAESLYLVQDFEDDYVDWTNLDASNVVANLSGNFVSPDLTIGQVDVYFDDWANLTTCDLELPPYNGSYDFGTFVGSISGSKLVLNEGVFEYPQLWNQSEQSFQVSFHLDAFFSKFGTGIYTLRLWSESGECVTNFSVFNPD